jgi:AcrR family transcriptional regulator
MNPVPEHETQDPKWRRLPEERPRQILLAAIEEFAEHGIAGAKLDNIATRAGLSKGTIYLYFASKEDLFKAVVRDVVVPRIVEVEQAVPAGEPRDQLKAYLRLHWEQFATGGHAGWVRLVLTELHKHPDLSAFYIAEISTANRLLADILSRGMDAGAFRRMSPHVAVSMIKAVSLMHVLWSQMPASPAMAASKPRVTIDDITDFVLNALRPDAPESGANSHVP